VKIQDLWVAKSVYKRMMEAPIMVTQRELLLLSPKVRAQVANMTIKRCIPCEAMAQTMVEEASNDSKPK